MNTIICIVFLILFLLWQLFIIKKYYIGYALIKINNKDSEIIIDKNHINYNDIKAIRIVPCEKQPSILERAFSKSAFHVYLTNIELYLKNGVLIPFKCNSKSTVNKLITEVTPFVETISDEREENTDNIKAAALASITIIIVMLVCFFTVIHYH